MSPGSLLYTHGFVAAAAAAATLLVVVGAMIHTRILAAIPRLPEKKALRLLRHLELDSSIHIANRALVKQKLEALISGGAASLAVTADWDRTITKGSSVSSRTSSQYGMCAHSNVYYNM